VVGTIITTKLKLNKTNFERKEMNWGRRKVFLLFLYEKQFLLLKQAGGVYSVTHADSSMTDVFYNKDLDGYISSFL